MVKQFKIVVEKHADAYVAYPIGTKDVVVGEGQSNEEALADVRSAIAFHIESFGADALEPETPVSVTPSSEEKRLDAIYALLGISFESGESDIAARHDEHLR